MKNITVIFGAARCGSNYFLSACKRFDRLTTLGEVYHRHAVYPLGMDYKEDYTIKTKLLRNIVDKYPAQIGLQPQDLAEFTDFSGAANIRLDEILVKFSHAHFKLFFAEIGEIGNHPNIIFKIFPEHLGPGQILQLIGTFRPRIVLMVRNPLDTFISGLKASITKQYGTADTTELKIPFKPEAYFAYKASLTKYYDTISQYCTEIGLGYSVISYEDIHSDKATDSVEYIRQSLTPIFGDDLPYTQQEVKMPLFTRQDRAGSTAEKVENPQDLPLTAQTLAILASPFEKARRIPPRGPLAASS